MTRNAFAAGLNPECVPQPYWLGLLTGPTLIRMPEREAMRRLVGVAHRMSATAEFADGAVILVKKSSSPLQRMKRIWRRPPV